MTTRFTYSRWDGTQKGFEVDAESLLEAVTDDLLYHGDVNSALRRLMQPASEHFEESKADLTIDHAS